MPDIVRGEIIDDAPEIMGYIDGVRGAQGYSAYEIAVQQGYTGTEVEWIASLHGEKGDAGPQGSQGIPGNDGRDGNTPVITAERSGSVTTIKADGVAIATLNDGEDGYAPIITASKTGTVSTIYVDGVAIATVSDGTNGKDGKDGQNGADGISPTISVATITGGHRLTITDATGTKTVDVMNGDTGPAGAKGDRGDTGPAGVKGDDGFSPTVSVTEITGGHRVVITDVSESHTFDVMDGEGGSGGTSDYEDLTNKPSIAGITLEGNKTLAQLGIASSSDIPAVPVQSVNGKTGAVTLGASDVGALPNNTTASDLGAYVKPSGGIPKTDLANGVQSSLNSADSAYQKPTNGIPKTDLASSVQSSLGLADSAYQKPSGGIPASDLASGVIPNVPVQSVNGQTGAVVLAIPSSASDVGAIAAPASPATGAFLVWSGSAWVAQTLSAWQGGSY